MAVKCKNCGGPHPTWECTVAAKKSEPLIATPTAPPRAAVARRKAAGSAAPTQLIQHPRGAGGGKDKSMARKLLDKDRVKKAKALLHLSEATLSISELAQRARDAAEFSLLAPLKQEGRPFHPDPEVMADVTALFEAIKGSSVQVPDPMGTLYSQAAAAALRVLKPAPQGRPKKHADRKAYKAAWAKARRDAKKAAGA